MSACTSLTLHYHSPSLPEKVSVANSEDGQTIQRLLTQREEKSSLLMQAGQILLDHPSLARLMGYQASYVDGAGPVSSIEEAIARLDKDYWDALLKDCQFTMLMPAKRRDAFLAATKTAERPPFTPEHVIPTVQGWLLDQDQFFAERVDGIFHALSETHITNSPAGFGGKMIVKMSQSGYGQRLDDLRLVLQCLTGALTPLEAASRAYGSEAMLDKLVSLKCFNTPISVDNGTITLRVFKVGTCHLTIDPELAAHLNDILSMLYHLSIPAKFRTQSPIRASRKVASAQWPIPPRILATLLQNLKDKCFGSERGHTFYEELAACYPSERRARIYYSLSLPDGAERCPDWQRVIEALGGVFERVGEAKLSRAVFNYNVGDLRAALSLLGSVPDKKDHQFYPTRGKISRDLASRVEAHHEKSLRYLEPSAGQGDLLNAMPFIDAMQWQTVELSLLSAEILRAKKYRVIQDDFLRQAKAWYTERVRFDRIVMNPPFSDQQAKDHTLAAFHLLSDEGKLFAVLPTSLRDAFDHLPARIVKSAPYREAFEGTRVETFILELHKR